VTSGRNHKIRQTLILQHLEQRLLQVKQLF
jgi:hypothetical protein